MSFNQVGKIEKVHDALQVQVDGWTLGTLVIAAGNVSNLLNGHAVEVNFVQQRPGREIYIGYAGTARLSSPAPIIDADAVQRKPIDAGLVRGGF